MRRVDVRAGLLFVAAGVPGSVIGSVATHWLDRRVFEAETGQPVAPHGKHVRRRSPAPVLHEQDPR